MPTSADFDSGAFVRALLDPESPPPDDLEGRDGVSPARRFAVYRNNICVGLVDALAERFPVCRQLVGDEFFRAMARHYVRRFLPCSPILFEYGDEFATFVSTFEPARQLPYLGDVARLEYAVGQSFHAADAAPLPMEKLRALQPERLARATATLHPSAYVLASRYPIISIWKAHLSDDERNPLNLDDGEEALVVRPALEIRVTILPAGGSAFVSALQEGKTFGAAMAVATGIAADFDLTGCLRELIVSEAFVTVSAAR
ncbi:MAG: DUF2063 domain-containing protein [Methylocystis sp.]|uniref:HvfC/BufC N-terminal domain-containing protein n=1 Tax=Methylocystis sp. TaxID=1911079 RepID=UPI003D0C82D8